MLEANKKVWIAVIGFVLLVWAVLLIWIIFFYSGKKTSPPEKVPPVAEEKPTLANDILPTNTKTPEEFVQKVKDKADDIQRNYDSNLADFAAKKWSKFFRESNSVDEIYLNEHLQTLSKEVRKTDDQSTIFKIKYRIEKNGSTAEAEDFFFLMLSEAKKNELGLSNLKSNTFLSEEDIRKNLGKENFAQITKIQK